MYKDDNSLLDIFRAGQRILSFVEGLSRAELEADVMRQSAILYQIEIMGEATKRLSQGFREQHSDIPWRAIAGMRDVVIHQYEHACVSQRHRIDFDLVWQAIQRNIPEVLAMIAPLLPEGSIGVG